MADLRGVPEPACLGGAAAGVGKKRLCALAEWVFGGGEDYCAACEGPCPDCPHAQNRPLTLEGADVWRLAQAAGGQIRVAGLGVVVGYDMTAVLALARARGVDSAAAGELMPHIEAVMVRRLTREPAAGTGSGVNP